MTNKEILNEIKSLIERANSYSLNDVDLQDSITDRINSLIALLQTTLS